jgi:hypothetical protein
LHRLRDLHDELVDDVERELVATSADEASLHA